MLNLANRAGARYRHAMGSPRHDPRIDLGGGGTACYQYGIGKQRTRKRIVNQNDLADYWETHLSRRLRALPPLQRQRSMLVEEIESHHLFEGEQRVLLVDDVI